MTYIVTVPLVQVATAPKGVAVQVMKGGPVPTNITEEALANLIDLGYVEEAAEVAEVEEPSGPPAKSASKGEWEAYARSQGATDEDLDGVTKDDLVTTYGE